MKNVLVAGSAVLPLLFAMFSTRPAAILER
jgi:hypothetical protein